MSCSKLNSKMCSFAKGYFLVFAYEITQLLRVIFYFFVHVDLGYCNFTLQIPKLSVKMVGKMLQVKQRKSHKQTS